MASFGAPEVVGVHDIARPQNDATSWLAPFGLRAIARLSMTCLDPETQQRPAEWLASEFTVERDYWNILAEFQQWSVMAGQIALTILNFHEMPPGQGSPALPM